MLYKGPFIGKLFFPTGILLAGVNLAVPGRCVYLLCQVEGVHCLHVLFPVIQTSKISKGFLALLGDANVWLDIPVYMIADL